jgi:uncharacterized GH25 family protein
MRKVLLGVVCALTAAGAASAHFVFVVPDAGGARATVVFSEDLQPDEGVSVAKVAPLKLTARDAATGKESPVELRAGEHALAAAVPGAGARVVYGSVTFGVMQRGKTPAYLLVYHPKALVGAVPADRAAVGAKLPAELIPLAAGGKVRFQLVAAGKPVAAAQVTVIKPDGSRVKLPTGADGRTEAVEGSGRWAAWVRYTEPKAGEHDGKKYGEVRHYATLVADTGNR